VAGVAALLNLGCCIASHPAGASDQSRALQEITDTADRLCGAVATSGETTSIKLKGDVKAAVAGLVKHLADLGVNGTGEIEETKYQGIIQTQLGETLHDIRKCKLTIFKTLEQKLIEPSEPANAIHGKLLPGNDETPTSPCRDDPGNKIESGASFLFYGSNSAFAHSFPHTVISVYGKDVLWLDKDKSDELAVNLEIDGEDGRNIVKIVNNYFTINTNNFFGMEWPDRHTLVVYANDKIHSKVLAVKYLNEQAISLTGRIRIRNLVIDIGSEVTKFAGLSLSHTCFGGDSIADIAIGQ
jgi:hypothetical protein